MEKIKIILKIVVVLVYCVVGKVSFAFTDLSESNFIVNQNTNLDLAGSPYIINTISIQDDAELTIEPGVILKFKNTENSDGTITVTAGSIIADGDTANPVIFTSYNDDIGGDTNGDGNLTEPQTGDWYGIFFGEQNPVPSTFDNVEVFYSEFGLQFGHGAVTNATFRFNNEALMLFGGNFGPEPLAVSNLIFQNNGTALTLAIAKAVSLSNFTFEDSNDVAVVVDNYSHFTCTGCLFEGGEIGIVVREYSDLTLSDSVIQNYSLYGIYNNFVFQSFVPDQNNSEISILNSEIKNNDIGIQLDENASGVISNNLIHDNTQYGVFLAGDTTNPSLVNLENNWWGHDSGPHELINNPNGLGDNLSVVYASYIPWTGQPVSMTLHQYKYDGVYEISEGGTNTSDKFVFKIKGSLVVPNRKIEVEIKTQNTAFDGMVTRVSDFQNNTDTLTLKIDNIPEGSDKWRARILNANNAPGPWMEFGQAQNGVDFVAKPVPHYTQNLSSHPNFAATQEWSIADYANGTGRWFENGQQKGCGLTIGACGCALTSGVMVMRYYGINIAEGNDVNPLKLDEWLVANNGYGHHGDVDWYKIATYSGNQIKFAERTSSQNNAKLDEYLNLNQPAIAYMNKDRKLPGAKGGGHFVVISNKLQNTYEILDPANYDTYTLNDIPVAGQKIRKYFNGYDGLRLFKPSNGVAQVYTKIHMASPAEVLVTDSVGRRVGRNPLTGQTFQEIPNSLYISEIIDDPDAENVDLNDHEWKTAYIPDLGSNFDIDVFGTGNGEYRLDINSVAINGMEEAGFHEGDVVLNETQSFSAQVAPAGVTVSDEDLDHTVPSTTLSLLQAEGIQWSFSGTDENLPVVKNISKKDFIFTAEDRYGNKNEIDFDVTPGDRVPAFGKLNLELKRVTINGANIKTPYTWLSYDWDNAGGSAVMFDQRLSIGDTFVRALYNQTQNQTIVTVVNSSGTQTTLYSKIKLLKFKVSSNGQLSYEL